MVGRSTHEFPEVINHLHFFRCLLTPIPRVVMYRDLGCLDRCDGDLGPSPGSRQLTEKELAHESTTRQTRRSRMSLACDRSDISAGEKITDSVGTNCYPEERHLLIYQCVRAGAG